jgi:hypothetical protein
MMDAIRFSKTSVLTRATRRYVQEDSIALIRRRENVKFCMSADSFEMFQILQMKLKVLSRAFV